MFIHRDVSVQPDTNASSSLRPNPSGTATRGVRGSTVRVALRHMDVVLSIPAGDGGHDGATLGETDILDAAAVAGLAADPVFNRLISDVDAANEADGIVADALRLALVARWLRRNGAVDAGLQAPPARGALPKWRFNRVAAYVDAHIGEAISLADLAAVAGLSKMYFAAQFRAATGLRPHEYVLRRRIERAKALLAETTESLVGVALGVGFQNQAHFTTVFKRFAGETPRQWRSNYRPVV